MQVCARCNRDDVEFNQGQNWCKACQSSYKKQWRADNKDHIKSYKRQYDISNIDANREYLREYRVDNKDSVAENRREYVNDRRANDPVFRLNGIISSTINKSLKKSESSKNG